MSELPAGQSMCGSQQSIGGLGKALKWGGRVAGAVPAVGTAANAVLGGVGGVAQGLANGEGLKGGLMRAGTNIATGSIPGGAGIAAGIAGDAAMNKILAPKPQGPATGPMPGMLGQGHLPGMAM